MLGSPPDPQHPAVCPRGGHGAAPVAGPGGHLAGLDLAGTTLERVLHVGDKSLLVSGHHGGRPVVVKVLTTEERFWRDALAHEIAVHRTLARAPAPVRTPELVHTDGARLLVIEQLPGHPLGRVRYPRQALPEAEVSAVITAVTDFAAWAPPAEALAPVFDYRDRLTRYRWCLDDTGSTVLDRLLDRLGAPTVPAHGDPLPTNLLVTADDRGTRAGSGAGRRPRCALLDLEYTGLFLPGFDLAMLYTLLVATPNARSRIRRVVAASGIEAAFLVNRAIVLTRELRIHRELDDGPLRRDRLAVIEPQLSELRAELHALAAEDR